MKLGALPKFAKMCLLNEMKCVLFMFAMLLNILVIAVMCNQLLELSGYS